MVNTPAVVEASFEAQPDAVNAAPTGSSVPQRTPGVGPGQQKPRLGRALHAMARNRQPAAAVGCGLGEAAPLRPVGWVAAVGTDDGVHERAAVLAVGFAGGLVLLQPFEGTGGGRGWAGRALGYLAQVATSYHKCREQG